MTCRAVLVIKAALSLLVFWPQELHPTGLMCVNYLSPSEEKSCDQRLPPQTSVVDKMRLDKLHMQKLILGLQVHLFASHH